MENSDSNSEGDSTVPLSIDSNNSNDDITTTSSNIKLKQQEEEGGDKDGDHYMGGDNNDDDDGEEYEEYGYDEFEDSVTSHYWTEDQEVQQEVPDIPTTTNGSLIEFHRNFARNQILASDDDLVMLENDHITKDSNDRKSVGSPLNDSKRVKFNTSKKVFHFEKHPLEDTLEQHHPNQMLNYLQSLQDDSDEDDDDDDEEEEDFIIHSDDSDDSDDEDDDDDDDDEDYSDENNMNGKRYLQDSSTDDNTSDDDNNGDGNGEKKKKKKRNKFVFYQYNYKSDSEDELPVSVSTPSSSSSTTLQNNNTTGQVNENVNKKQEHEEEESDPSETGSVVSVEEHFDSGGEVEANDNSGGNNSGKFFDLANYNPFNSTQSTQSSNSNPHNVQVNNDNLQELRTWAKRPQPIRYVPRYINVNNQNNDKDNQNKSTTTTTTTTTSSEEDNYGDDEEDEEDEDEDEYQDDEEVTSSQEDNQDYKLNEIIEKRSEIEKKLQAYRERTEFERKRLRDCFNQAKQNLKQKIDMAAKHFNHSTTGSSLDSSLSVIVGDHSLLSNNGNGTDTIKDELEEVLDSLSQLQQKIDDMELVLVDSESTSPTSSTNTLKSKSNKLNSKSLVAEFLHLKEQIEKERKEKIDRDRELEDITKHLLDMALQVSNTIFVKTYTDDSGNLSTNSSNDNQQNERLEKEIEFYRNQIESLEKRLTMWKHHNEMLHMELLMDKQNNSQEFLNLSTKIQQVEEERDSLSMRIDQLVADLGAMEGRESVLSNRIEDLINDKQSLSEIIVEMEKEKELIANRFSQLVIELREMGESQVIKLQTIVEEMIFEREELENSIRDTKEERNNLISTLNTLNQQLISLEDDKKSIVDRCISSEQSNTKLLLDIEETIKKLEVSETQCLQLQSQLSVVNRRLSWAESEVERLTKEMNRLVNVSGSIDQSNNGSPPISFLSNDDNSTISTSPPLPNNNNNSNNSDIDNYQDVVVVMDNISTTTPTNSENNERIKMALESIRENVLTMKGVLVKEKSEILQLGSDLAHVVEKGKIKSSDTISSIKDYILREVSNTKLDISNKLNEINSQQLEQQQQDINNNNNNQNNEEYLIQEINNQKSKLNEMQSKIIKLENQLLEITTDNNHLIGDQVEQLMKMESKIKKMEVGISELIDYKSPTPATTTPLSSTTTTTTTTTTTHHHHLHFISPNVVSEQSSTSNVPSLTDQQDLDINNQFKLNPPNNNKPSFTSKDNNQSSPSSQQPTTPSPNVILQNYNTITPGNDQEVLDFDQENSSNTTNSNGSKSSNKKKQHSNSNNVPSNNSLQLKLQSILSDSLLIGTSSFLTTMFYNCLNYGTQHIDEFDITSSSPIEILSSLSKKSIKYGVGVMALTALIQSSWLPMKSSKLQSISNNTNNSTLQHTSKQSPLLTDSTGYEENNTNQDQLINTTDNDNTTATITATTNNNNTTTTKELILSGVIGGVLCGGSLYIKHRKPEFFITGSLIGIGLGVNTVLTKNNTN